MPRLPRVAIAVLPGLDHFVPDLVAALNATRGVEARVFRVETAAALGVMLAWADRTESDAVWFEFCWPPFPVLIAATDFGGRRVIVRIHRIEAYETDLVRDTDWSRVTDVIVVGHDMAGCVRAAAPEIAALARLHVVHNGLALDRFVAAARFDRFRIGWCGSFILRKNPLLALEILHRLRGEDARFHLHIATKGGERLATDAFRHLANRLRLGGAIHLDGAVPAASMPGWHARNGVLLSTSLHESFGYAIAEAAACGCDIAVLDTAGADEFWPAECRFFCVEEAVAMIRAARPHRWRDWVAARFDVRCQADRILAIVGGTVTEQLDAMAPAAS